MSPAPQELYQKHSGGYMSNRERGAKGEAIAAAYMCRQGYTVLQRNYRAGRCEIDLILKQGETIVFAEVKARTTGAYGLGREAVTPAKQHNIIKAAQAYLAANGLYEAPIRFDVLEVELFTNAVNHIPAAFML